MFVPVFWVNILLENLCLTQSFRTLVEFVLNIGIFSHRNIKWLGDGLTAYTYDELIYNFLMSSVCLICLIWSMQSVVHMMKPNLSVNTTVKKNSKTEDNWLEKTLSSSL